MQVLAAHCQQQRADFAALLPLVVRLSTARADRCWRLWRWPQTETAGDIGGGDDGGVSLGGSYRRKGPCYP